MLEQDAAKCAQLTDLFRGKAKVDGDGDALSARPMSSPVTVEVMLRHRVTPGMVVMRRWRRRRSMEQKPAKKQ
ncbi:unnamed protein product [Arctogadus glacialis]